VEALTRPLTPLRSVEQLDGPWLAAALGSGPVVAFEAREIGTGQMSESHRVALRYEDAERQGPATVVLKLAAADPRSRATGVGMGIYEREIRFYLEIAPRLGGPLADCRLAVHDPADGWFTLVLEDAAPALVGDQIAGCSVSEARLALSELARLHAPAFEDQTLAASSWLNRPSPVDQALVGQLLPAFLERYGDRIAAEHRALCERFVQRLDGWLQERPAPQGLVHGDFRLDNLLFGQAGSPRPLTVVDWQTVGWGDAMTDATYFVGGGLPVEERRQHERELLAEYHEALCRLGVRGFDWEQCFRAYRRQTFAGLLMAVVASMLVQRTERGDDMFMAMLARHGQHALDLDAEQLLDSGGRATGAPPAPLRPHADDEGRHEPGPEELWNESWYFDAIAPDGGLGAWVRIGLYPNLGVCWYTALACGPGRPTVAAIDFAAPLPSGDGLAVRTRALTAEHRCVRPLERFALSLQARAQRYVDAAALLRGEPGEPASLELELEWGTVGIPYSYRLTTRYEIPCLVEGEIRIDGEALALSEAPGQRDHSWGTRDWWAMDWLWSAAHLDDGAHLHAVELRLPGAARLGVGYVQSAGGELVELERVSASERLAADGLIAEAGLHLEPGELGLAIEPLAFAPLRLVSRDGRVSHFPRAMCRVRGADGRTGLGWVEWNLNQSQSRARSGI
jgi:Ecdysteroid kinase-like family